MVSRELILWVCHRDPKGVARLAKFLGVDGVPDSPTTKSALALVDEMVERLPSKGEYE